MQLFELFPNEEAAERWWTAKRWPHGVTCPRCGSIRIQDRETRKPQPLTTGIKGTSSMSSAATSR